MLSQEIRRNFLKYFKEQGHVIVPSSSTVPHEDPTLLFTNAGMNQFKDAFLGKSARDYTRAASSQKCIRVGGKHNDLDNVGHTSRHLTFFEMLGNFSFGDYFKKEAIAYAWDVSTRVFQFEPERIWITVFQDDDEAFELWKGIVPEKRIVRLGEKDNFWAMGETGPCGPCSELYFDKGAKYGEAPSPKEDTAGERYLEFWNLVFMQFNRSSDGAMTPLPKQSIDTGSGLERVISLKMGVDSLFGTDIFVFLIHALEKICGTRYDPANLELAPAFHVIADHIRLLSFAVADGAQPSNLDRGYVLRKVLRRAVRYGRMLELQEPFLAKLLPALVEIMGADYPELKSAKGRIEEILTLEEEAFFRTLKRGGNILNTVITEAKTRAQKEITGKEAFTLKDTYGLPLEEVLLMAKDMHLTVNLDAFYLLEEQAKEKSRGARSLQAQEMESSFYQDLLKEEGPSEFVGYDHLQTESTLLAILVDGKRVEKLHEGQSGVLLLDKTPFYAEKGGQVGDTGVCRVKECQFVVTGCTSPIPGVILHQGICQKGVLFAGEPLQAEVDRDRRLQIQNNHTATHLLHYALGQVLGAHVKQAGSLVETTRLRFDFNHHKALTKEELHRIEDIVNEKICQNQRVSTYELAYEEAQKKPQIKQFFGDKYGSKVRVVDIDFSQELCGGTHAGSTGTIGLFRITKEGSIAAGVRRIEAVTGKGAEEFCREQERGYEEKLEAQAQEIKQLKDEIKGLRRAGLKEKAAALVAKSQGGVVVEEIAIDPSDLGAMAEALAGLMPAHALVLAAKDRERCQLLCRLSADFVKRGLSAVALIKEIAPLVGGSGGGKAESAQAGGKEPAGVEVALKRARELLGVAAKR